MNKKETIKLFKPKPNGRVVCNFSCGAASAVATKLAIKEYKTVEIIYCDTGSEHPDNKRFLTDCEKWFGQKITILKSAKYKNIFEVFEKTRFLSSAYGAPCTGEMKKKPAQEFWRLGDTEVFGYTADEQHRLERWKRDNPERIIKTPLIDKFLTKQDCYGALARAKIELPAQYKLGFNNNNCITCVKARDSLDYWRRVRKYHPAEFQKMAKLEKDIGHAINRQTINGEKQPIFLDDIPPGDPIGRAPDIQCGLFCMAEMDA